MRDCRNINDESFNAKAFGGWLKRSLNATKKILKDPPKLNTKYRWLKKIYSDFKEDILIPVAGKKCMYCEGDYSGGSTLHAEHFRPKSEVTENRLPVKNHNGYYWLAYDWQNILLSCEHCNTYHRRATRGEEWRSKSHPGKLTEFPIQGSRIHLPHTDMKQWYEDLKKENPLLLNPYKIDPYDHFEAKEFGVLRGKTPQGRATIEICDLNRSNLCEKRLREADHQCQNNLYREYIKVRGNEKKIKDIWGDMRGPYSMYVTLWVRKAVKRLFNKSGNI